MAIKTLARCKFKNLIISIAKHAFSERKGKKGRKNPKRGLNDESKEKAKSRSSFRTLGEGRKG